MGLAVRADGVGNTLEEAAVELVEVHKGGFSDFVLTDTVHAADATVPGVDPWGSILAAVELNPGVDPWGSIPGPAAGYVCS